MIAEIICVGDELVLGEVLNTNAQFLAKELLSLGINSQKHTIVKDKINDIKYAINKASKTSNIIILTGGLGPTDDDITMQAVASAFDVDLTINNDALNNIEKFFQARNIQMPISNKKQALIPQGATILKNPVGTAPGIIWKFKQNKFILAFPGVPYEMTEMWIQSAKDYLKNISSKNIKIKNLKHFGIPEAKIGEKIKDLMEEDNPQVAPYVDNGTIRIRINAQDESKEKAESLLKNTEKEILKRTGRYFYGYDNDTLESVISVLLKKNNLTVSIAESCTGGLISSKLTDVSGSSKYIKLNLVTYSNEAKINMINVSEQTLIAHGAVSQDTAKEMAKGIQKLSGCDIGLGITGIAGPTGGTPEKPVGLVYIGICDNKKLNVHKVQLNSKLPRFKIKTLACDYALNYLRIFLLNEFSINKKTSIIEA